MLDPYHIARLNVFFLLFRILERHEYLGFETRSSLRGIEQEILIIRELINWLLKNVKVEWRLACMTFDVEEVLIVDHLPSFDEVESWLNSEPRVYSRLRQVHLTAPIFLRHFLKVDIEILSTEDMLELDRLSVSDLFSNLEALLVFVVVILCDLLGIIFINGLLKLIDIGFEILHDLLVDIVLTSTLFNGFCELDLQLSELFSQLMTFGVDVTPLLDL